MNLAGRTHVRKVVAQQVAVKLALLTLNLFCPLEARFESDSESDCRLTNPGFRELVGSFAVKEGIGTALVELY